MHTLLRIISGGQTGADQGGLMAATTLGLPTGGMAPKGWLTEAGPYPELGSRWGLEESTSGYAARTRHNVVHSDATVVFGDVTSSGSRLTLRTCTSAGKPCIVNPTPQALQEFVKRHAVVVLNVAGNRESVNPGIAMRVQQVIVEAFNE